MSSKSFRALLSGVIGILAAGLASAGTLTEYSSLAAWNAPVSNVSSYRISQLTTGLGGETTPPRSPRRHARELRAGVFTGDTGSGVIYNDGVYGTGVQYFSDDPRAEGQHGASLRSRSHSAPPMTYPRWRSTWARATGLLTSTSR